MAKEHTYSVTLTWTGDQGEGTSDYKAYTRDYDIACEGKPVLKGSADPNYFGDGARHNPEDMLVASLSACHMLWYLHLCAVSKVVVTAYEDHAEGRDGGEPGRLRPIHQRHPQATHHDHGGKRCGHRRSDASKGERHVLRRQVGQFPRDA